MSDESTAPVQPGDVLAGKYRVERVLGVGGMGVVVSATHLELGQRVALKFLLPKALEHPEAAERFLREARAAVRIQSEHVARVIDVGRLETSAPYMVMEYLEGHDLSDHPKGTALPVEDAVDFILQACEAMSVAHSSGIVHRDLKPANLFLTERPDGSPVVKVLDFGISKVADASTNRSDLTRTSAVMGSPLYMSPEQTRSARKVDARTDIWALGVILYELLAGELPFDGESVGEVFAAVIISPPEPLGPRRPGLPPGLEDVVMRALEKSPDARYSNVGELARALQAYAPERSRGLVERVSNVLSRAGISSALPTVATRPKPSGAATNVDVASGARSSTNVDVASGARSSTNVDAPPTRTDGAPSAALSISVDFEPPPTKLEPGPGTLPSASGRGERAPATMLAAGAGSADPAPATLASGAGSEAPPRTMLAAGAARGATGPSIAATNNAWEEAPPAPSPRGSRAPIFLAVAAVAIVAAIGAYTLRSGGPEAGPVATGGGTALAPTGAPAPAAPAPVVAATAPVVTPATPPPGAAPVVDVAPAPHSTTPTVTSVAAASAAAAQPATKSASRPHAAPVVPVAPPSPVAPVAPVAAPPRAPAPAAAPPPSPTPPPAAAPKTKKNPLQIDFK